MLRSICFVVALTFAPPLAADPVEVEDVVATRVGDSWRFDVTVRHPDTGWDHYADGWRVLDAEGTELGLRVLAHPHVEEQPFTRSLSGVVIPDGATEVFIQTRCSVDGWGESLTPVQLTP